MDYLVRKKGEDLLRYKGILHIKGMEQRIVFQGPNMRFPDIRIELETRRNKNK